MNGTGSPPHLCTTTANTRSFPPETREERQAGDAGGENLRPTKFNRPVVFLFFFSVVDVVECLCVCVCVAVFASQPFFVSRFLVCVCVCVYCCYLTRGGVELFQYPSPVGRSAAADSSTLLFQLFMCGLLVGFEDFEVGSRMRGTVKWVLLNRYSARDADFLFSNLGFWLG